MTTSAKNHPDWENLLCPTTIRHFKPGPKPDKISGLPEFYKDRRTKQEKDLGKVIFSTPFRRLQDKAQVFPLESIDGIRNRASHSAEVANVARDLAKAVSNELRDRGQMSPQEADAFTIVANVCGHVHDFGNPPFGHAGEDAIKTWFEQKDEAFWEGFGVDEVLQKDFTHFDGNAQTLRLVSGLQVLADLNGLNLTAGTFAAMVKYRATAATMGQPGGFRKKLGCFESERELLENVQNATGTEARRHPITFLVEAADDIVYGACDIEDAVKKGLISWSDITDDLLYCRTSGDWSVEQKEVLSHCRSRTVEFVENRVGGLDLTSRELDEANVQYFKAMAIGFGVDAVYTEFLDNLDAIMAGKYEQELLYNSRAAALYDCLKNKIGVNRIYRCREAAALEVLGTNIIHGLLDLFVQAFPAVTEGGHRTSSKYHEKILSLLSANYRRAFGAAQEVHPELKGYYQLRLLTDYICGMTDTFALNLHRQLHHEP